MTNIELIENLDGKIKIIYEQWGEDLAMLLKKHKEGSKKFNAEKAKLEKKYAPLLAKIIVFRDEVFEKEAAIQEAAYAAQFSEPEEEKPLLDEDGRPRNMIWKDGKWQQRKPKTE